MEELGHHFNEEELADLPALENTLPPDDSKKLAESFNSRKTFLPSRCHVIAPDHPPLDAFAGFVAAPLDFVGDLMRKFPEDVEKGS